jgi:hypothetical protein
MIDTAVIRVTYGIDDGQQSSREARIAGVRVQTMFLEP